MHINLSYDGAYVVCRPLGNKKHANICGAHAALRRLLIGQHCKADTAKALPNKSLYEVMQTAMEMLHIRVIGYAPET